MQTELLREIEEEQKAKKSANNGKVENGLIASQQPIVLGPRVGKVEDIKIEIKETIEMEMGATTGKRMMGGDTTDKKKGMG